jgi:hypothetical protein
VGGAFEELLSKCLIDHRWTSPAHAQSNGLAEKCVGTIKRALRKVCEERASVRDWEEHLCWIGLGYRCSKQRSLGMSPYELLYARKPVIPPGVHDKWQEPLDLDDPERAAELVLARSKLAREQEAVAAANLRIRTAQGYHAVCLHPQWSLCSTPGEIPGGGLCLCAAPRGG